jgi:hypothetical protein
VEEIQPEDTIYFAATHRLTFSNRYQFGGDNQMHVICLKTLIEKLKKGESAE